ncbi:MULTISPECIES: DUF2274 domain-containing protein [unclassified Caulobacter]|jgi:hypothetical protein|uniref:DUF2274 domain-containing protein n=1 Tax=unclassified Caulobacter TaxID=2648921 RepID=UPI000782BCC3|nr:MULTISPECIES: DUF2274 domain-containing protein [unclassified Caulobacter]MBQ1561475.1 DUF2274 domain-containing protein [Caulobacter sp.]MCK5911426.1 DUF2274 domain-containing protein [Caulobacter sp.]PIB96268.1 DUF2274 domain-containing protein [Caulobacter sp. X]
MADLKLGKLPNRTPVKLTLSIMPDVEDALGDYATIYNTRNGVEASPADLGASMIEHFLLNDREFVAARKTLLAERQGLDPRPAGAKAPEAKS